MISTIPVPRLGPYNSPRMPGSIREPAVPGARVGSGPARRSGNDDAPRETRNHDMPRPLRFAFLLLGPWLVAAGGRAASAAEDFAFYHENVMGTSLELRVRADAEA